jgi:hypothetical protein
MKRNYIFLITLATLFLTLSVIFIFFPRPKFSEVERRELTTAPTFSLQKLLDGSYTAEVSSWFSDSEPFRDSFMTLSMAIKSHMALHRGSGDQQFVFHQTADINEAIMPGGESDADLANELAERDIPNADSIHPGNDAAKMSQSGILIVGSGDNVRALMRFGGTETSTNPYISAINAYATALPNVKIYSMVAPIAMEFYCPEDARKRPGLFKSELPVIKHIYSSLSSNVHTVNVYTTLAEHADENIYLRTDHHWAPLGAFYAAREFARIAGVHQPVLSEFDAKTIHRFIGSMYGYSKDISIKNAPEDFIYYTPTNTNYQATFTNVNVDKDFHITGESKPYKTSYFKHFKDGSGNAYLTFMGSDFVTVKVSTWVNNSRRLLILKDSYGNAVPSNLFGSFEEVHVIDFRYFPHNIVDYCHRNNITDLLIINNVFNACSAGVAAKIKAMLTHSSGFTAPSTAPHAPTDTAHPTTVPTKSSTEKPVGISMPSHPADSTAEQSSESAP